MTMVNTRSGGAYIPPGRLRLMQQQQLAELAADSEQIQRISWDALKKSINGLINKVNASNIKAIVPELFSEDLVRGRGLFCRSIMKAQSLALPFTPVYAAVVAVVNTKLPQVGELLVSRVVHQFRRAYRRNDRPQCLALLTLLAHLVNQQIVHEILALQVLALLLERPTADSVELAVGLARECGQYLEECASRAFHAVFDRFRDILHQADIDKRVQYMVEVLFQVRKDKFKDNPTLDPNLDLVEDDDRIIHEVSLDDELDPEDMLGIFQFDPNYLENQQKYQSIKKEILGSDDEGDEDGSSEEGSDEEEAAEDNGLKIIDKTGTNLVNLRRTIYLTVMSSVDFEECAHKLMKLKIEESDEVEVCTMIVECCSQERTYTKFYGLLGERFCKLNVKWAQHFEHVFMETYDSIHRYETNRLRSVARFFAHLFSGDAIPLPALSILRLTEEDTTASSRIFIKIMFQEMLSFLGLNDFKEKLHDPTIYPAIQPGLFPTDNPKNTRFAINYYTSIGLGALTDNLRQSLQEATAQAALIRAKRHMGSDSDSDDSSSNSSSSSGSSSDSSSGQSSASEASPKRSRNRSPLHQKLERHSLQNQRNVRTKSRSPSIAKRRRSFTPSRSPQKTLNRRDYRRSPSPPKRLERGNSRSPRPFNVSRRAHDRSHSPRDSHRSTHHRSPSNSARSGRRSRSVSRNPPRYHRRSRSPSINRDERRERSRRSISRERRR